MVTLRNSYSVQVGSSVTLQCVVTADPTHTVVKWERFVNGQLQDVTNVGAVGSGSRLTGSQVGTPSLTINQVTFQDEGNYLCTATNAIGTGKSQQTYLGVSGSKFSLILGLKSYEKRDFNFKFFVVINDMSSYVQIDGKASLLLSNCF